MPPVTMKIPTENQNKTDEELAVAKPVIGIIYPPPERAIIHAQKFSERFYVISCFPFASNGGIEKAHVGKMKTKSMYRHVGNSETFPQSPCTSKSTNAERCRRYRERQKKIDQYFNEKEKSRQRARRRERTMEQIARDRETAQERMRRYRLKKKTIVIKDPKDHFQPVMTRKQKETQREKWRKAKQKYRSSLSSQKKRRIREKDRQRHIADRHKQKESPVSNGTPMQPYTPAAERKAVYRTKSKMPSDPHKYATVVKGLIFSATPRKRKAIEENVEIMGPQKKKRLEFLETTMKGFKDVFHRLKQKRTKEDCRQRKVLGLQLARLKKYRLMNAAALELGVRYKSLLKWSKLDPEEVCMDRIKRSDALCENDVRLVQDFYLRPEISITHAGKKTVLKKDMVQKHTLNRTYTDLYKEYREKNPEKKISFSKFVALRPKNVEPSSKQRFRGCLCEKCTNIEFQLKAVNRNLMSNNAIKDKYAVNKMTLCNKDYETRANLNCVNRNCKDCGTQRIEKYLKDRRQRAEETHWYQWKTQKIVNEKTKSPTSRKMLILHHGTYDELVKSLMGNLETFTRHLFNASWQHMQFGKARSGLEEGDVLCVMDFAENYSIKNQEECQSAHWYSHQVTIHPIVCYYLQNRGEESNNQTLPLVTHEMVFISDDLNHDAFMVEHCVEKAIQTLRNILHRPIQRLIQFTDGCSAQYKSKTPFFLISKSDSNYDLHLERHYFGSGHGKGPADGCSGVVKASVTRAMKSGLVLNSAKDVFDFLQRKLKKTSETFNRSFLFVESKSINRTLTDSSLDTVTGTRQFHAVKAIAPGKIGVRKLSCFCPTCFKGDGKCEIDIIDDWEDKVVSKTLNKDVSRAVNNKVKKDISKVVIKDVNNNRKKVVNRRGEKVKKKTEQEPDETNIKDSLLKEKQNAVAHKDLDGENPNCLDYMVELEEAKEVTLQVKKNLSIVSSNKCIDGTATKILPNIYNHTGDTTLYPVIIHGDGNCLPRTASVLAYGNEDAHEDIRARIALEMQRNEDSYVSLSHITNIENKEREELVKAFTMYSPHYVSGTPISGELTRQIFRKEAEDVRNLGTYMGMWQICAMATILNSQIFSVYPNLGSPVVRKHLHRLIPPVGKASSSKAFIFWTSNRLDMNAEHWIPNHFVPLLPLTSSEEVQNESMDVEESFEILDTSSPDISAIIDMLDKEDSLNTSWSELTDTFHTLKAQNSSSLNKDAGKAWDSLGYEGMEECGRKSPVYPVLEPLVENQPHSVQMSDDGCTIECSNSVSKDTGKAGDDLGYEEMKECCTKSPVYPVHEPLVESQSHSVQMSDDGCSNCCKTGTYISVTHGCEVLPAVVDTWPYVRFFKKEKQYWVDNDILHTILYSDVHKILDPPNIIMKGSRLYYTFQIGKES